MAIVNAAISNIDTTLLEVPQPADVSDPAVRYAITTIMVCNTMVPNPDHEEDGETNFDMHFVREGDPKNNANMVIRSLVLPAGETFTFDSEKIVLESGDKIVLLGESPTNLSATVSYLEV